MSLKFSAVINQGRWERQRAAAGSWNFQMEMLTELGLYFGKENKL